MTDFKEEMRAKESVLNGEVIVLPLLRYLKQDFGKEFDPFNGMQILGRAKANAHSYFFIALA